MLLIIKLIKNQNLHWARLRHTKWLIVVCLCEYRARVPTALKRLEPVGQFHPRLGCLIILNQKASHFLHNFIKHYETLQSITKNTEI